MIKKSVVIVGGKRTAIGGFMGAFRDISAPHLGSLAAKAAL
jgi:acetyl-CoA C-acetyltransferase